MISTRLFGREIGRAGSVHRRGFLEDSLVIASAAAVSRLSGLVRVVAVASVLGSTVLGDLFVAINFLPMTLYSAFAGSAISSVLVPPLVRHLDRGDPRAARRLTANALGLVVVGLASLATLAILCRRWIAAALTAGVDDSLAADAAATASLLLLLILPQLVIYAAIGLFIAVQHAHRQFLVPSAGPILENVGLVATVAAAWWVFGGGWEVDDVPLELVLFLAVGSGLSVLIHGLVQFAGAWRAGGGFDVGVDWKAPDVKALAAPVKHSLGWTGVLTARHLALIVAAGFAGAGAVQALQIAMLAYFVPMALIGRPIASAALPRLSRWGTDRGTGFLGYLTALRLAACIAVPAGVAMTLLAGPIADAVVRGEFDRPGATDLVAFAVAGLGLGAAGEALFEVARQATMASGDGRSLRRSNIARGIIAVVGIPVVAVVLDGPPLLLGLGLVVSVGNGAAFAVAHVSLRAQQGWPPIIERYWPRIAAASLIAVLPVAVASTRISSGTAELRLLAVGLATTALYVGAVALLTDRGRMLRALHGSLRSEVLT